MSRATPDQIVAHVDLLRAVDRLLSAAEAVRARREALDRLLAERSLPTCSTQSKPEGVAHE
jgi:hypothetical protein